MKPIKFKESNKNLLKPQNMTDEECSSLWVFTDGRECISCWKMNFKQRISALIHGKVWLSKGKLSYRVRKSLKELIKLRKFEECGKISCTQCKYLKQVDEYHWTCKQEQLMDILMPCYKEYIDYIYAITM